MERGQDRRGEIWGKNCSGGVVVSGIKRRRGSYQRRQRGKWTGGGDKELETRGSPVKWARRWGKWGKEEESIWGVPGTAWGTHSQRTNKSGGVKKRNIECRGDHWGTKKITKTNHVTVEQGGGGVRPVREKSWVLRRAERRADENIRDRKDEVKKKKAKRTHRRRSTGKRKQRKI